MGAHKFNSFDFLLICFLRQLKLEESSREGFEPSTTRLTAGCSTAELPRHHLFSFFSKEREQHKIYGFYVSNKIPVEFYWEI